MKIMRKTSNELGNFERMRIALFCKNCPTFEIVNYDNGTIYINATNPNADRIESLINKIFEFDMLDTLDSGGKSAEHYLDELQKLTNQDAAFLLLQIWSNDRARKNKARAKAAAAEWLAVYNELGELPESYDGYFFEALYDMTRERSHFTALKALFYYGYLAGKTAAHTASQG